MDNEQIEEIYNQTFGGLTLFYRDTTLSENLISKYKVGQILTERGFTDMSFKGGGLATNFRYLIASANGKDLSAFNPNSEQFGHILLSSNAFFKVLDIYKIEDKTQVFLLEIPETAIDFLQVLLPILKKILQKKQEKVLKQKLTQSLFQNFKQKNGKIEQNFQLE